jgi:tetratricopeptide (TPR) repeat protein
VPALPAAFILLAAATLAPRHVRRRLDRGAPAARTRSASLPVRAGAIILSLACLVGIGIPLATTIAVRQSQTAASQGNAAAALADARRAARIEPQAATPQVQLALVFELRRDFPAAVDAARHAASNEPANWSTWLILSRLQAEDGHPGASLADYLRARSLNPRSPLFDE